MTPFTDYSGKKVVVTGASSGIGAATAQILHDLGAEVIGVARRQPETGHAGFVRLDLADPASIDDAITAIGPGIDRLFNCAGATPMLDQRTILATNYVGTRRFSEGVTEGMSEGGAVVHVSSDGGYGWRKHLDLLNEFITVAGFDESLAWYDAHAKEAGHTYGFAKEALNVWALQQSQVLIRRGIRTNIVSPGAVQTPMLEAIEAEYTADAISPVQAAIGRRSSAEEQAWPLVFLNSDLASYINGTDLVVDGGFWAGLSAAGALWGDTPEG